MLIQWLLSKTRNGRRCGSDILFSSLPGIQKGDEIGHLPALETRPSNALARHLVKHARAVMPERRHHCNAGERAAGDLRRAGGCVAVASLAVFGGKDALAAAGVAGVFEKLPRPEIAQQLAHLAGIEMRRLRLHFWRMIPHLGGDFRQRPAFDLRAKRGAGVMTHHAPFGLEYGFAIGAGGGLEHAYLFARGREIAQIDQQILQILSA